MGGLDGFGGFPITEYKTVTISNITGEGTLGISIAAGTGADVAGNKAPAAGPSDTFTVDAAGPAVAISTPSSVAVKSGASVTFAVTYTDSHFSSSTLSAANITLNKTGTANGTVSVIGTGLTRTVTISN
ncbi:MAG: hypothetical protein FWC53_00600, partial [Firmicutes bacterium]|nr:hypothetical protein [Bacillota bacterium]